TGTYTGPGNFFIVSTTGGISLYNPSGVKIYFDSPTPNDVAGKLGTNGFYTGTEINNLNQNGITFYWWAYA
ncbi:MAG: hypothetical protein GX638_18910, partial [Crenarchaeota archaeon]|nr:hypothetical protein [Thermoproteota archaeon]